MFIIDGSCGDGALRDMVEGALMDGSSRGSFVGDNPRVSGHPREGSLTEGSLRESAISDVPWAAISSRVISLTRDVVNGALSDVLLEDVSLVDASSVGGSLVNPLVGDSGVDVTILRDTSVEDVLLNGTSSRRCAVGVLISSFDGDISFRSFSGGSMLRCPFWRCGLDSWTVTLDVVPEAL